MNASIALSYSLLETYSTPQRAPHVGVGRVAFGRLLDDGEYVVGVLSEEYVCFREAFDDFGIRRIHGHALFQVLLGSLYCIRVGHGVASVGVVYQVVYFGVRNLGIAGADFFGCRQVFDALGVLLGEHEGQACVVQQGIEVGLGDGGSGHLGHFVGTDEHVAGLFVHAEREIEGSRLGILVVCLFEPFVHFLGSFLIVPVEFVGFFIRFYRLLECTGIYFLGHYPRYRYGQFVEVDVHVREYALGIDLAVELHDLGSGRFAEQGGKRDNVDAVVKVLGYCRRNFVEYFAAVYPCRGLARFLRVGDIGVGTLYLVQQALFVDSHLLCGERRTAKTDCGSRQHQYALHGKK